MKRFFASLVSVVMALILVTPVSAITEAQLNMFAQNNILFYDPNGANCNYTGGMTSTNANYAGAEVWSAAELQAVQANQAIYEEAANQYGFPWQILAVLHQKESSMKRYNDPNGQGVYQLYSYTHMPDPNDSTKQILNPDTAFLPAGEISEEEFRRQTLLAAGVVKSKMEGLDLDNPDDLKKLFFRYNGLSGEYVDKALAMGFTREQANNGEGSPYVMNRFDDRRDPTSASMDPLWAGRYEADGKYVPGSKSYRFGAYVLYLALGGNGGMYCNGGQGGIIFQTAMSLAKLGANNGMGSYVSGDKEPTPEYLAALNSYNAPTPCNETGCAPLGASCDQFVATVMRYSGADPDFPVINPPNQRDYMLRHPEKYQQIANTRDFSILQPGDIFVAESGRSRHIFIYGGERDGTQVQIGASFNQHTAYVYNFWNSWALNGVDYMIFRRIE